MFNSLERDQTAWLLSISLMSASELTDETRVTVVVAELRGRSLVLKLIRMLGPP